ncbi:type III secretion system protein SctP [Trinickia acidisoli]|uniref:type III secretion system protein SctP n=1 Tax=Trinickia acidisoli TaxID=2767482 RepID=UPI001A8F8492|nr:type III secretion system protein SctP [Trinickia acidisoli]
MTSISSRHARDPLDAELDHGLPSAGETQSRFDYAKLLRARAAPHRPVTRAGPISQHPPALSQQSGTREDDEQQRRAATADGQSREDVEPAITPDNAANRALASRVAHAAEPVVSSVLERQQRVLHLVGTLAREIAGFCSDPSIASSGNWEVQMRLDERLFPHTTLYLTLSCFTVDLRFDALDFEVKQLLLDHSSMLERELGAALSAWGESRDIKLTVW